MIQNSHPYDSATGVKLVMHEFLPDDVNERRPTAGIVIVHGLGDYTMRYLDTAQQLTDLGIAVVGIDLPGHGQSEGKRGKVGRLTDVHIAIDEARGVLREIVQSVDGKIGSLAHSAGGLLLLEYLTRFPGNFDFAWCNATLIRPTHRHSARTVTLSRIAKIFVPGHTISTKVTPAMGKEGDPEEHPPPEEGRGHDQVSVRFGHELIEAGKRIAEFHTNLKRDFRILFTHGTLDEVCPVEFARDFYSQLQTPNKEFREFPGHLHHTLHDPRVMEFGTDWLRRVLTPKKIKRGA